MRLFYFFAMLCIVSGCASSGPLQDKPPPHGYTIAPAMLSYKIASSDHIVVTNLPASQQDLPRLISYSLTITGQEVEQIIHAISSLRTSEYNHVPDVPTSYKWQLQFYRGTALLGAVDLSKDSVLDGIRGLSSSPLVFDGGIEYPAPRILRRLYHRVTKESQEHP
jgi:hypothetical protein